MHCIRDVGIGMKWIRLDDIRSFAKVTKSLGKMMNLHRQ